MRIINNVHLQTVVTTPRYHNKKNPNNAAITATMRQKKKGFGSVDAFDSQSSIHPVSTYGI
jgi:hypothetical protein